MHTPVSMLAGVAGKSNTSFVLTLLVGLAVIVALKHGAPAVAAPQTSPRS